jgi:basic amino acid/polyamine antiporter, APA family
MTQKIGSGDHLCYRRAMPETLRDEGLVRKVGPWPLAASIVSMVVGAGIFAVPSALAAAVGAYAPIAFLACGVAVGAVAICFAEGGSRMPTSGGVYGYIEAALGPAAGYVSGILLLLSDVLACGGVSAALADTVASVVPETLAAPTRITVIVGVVGAVALVNVIGVERGARLVAVVTAVKLIPLLIFVVVGIGHIHGENFVRVTEPGNDGLGRAVILAVFSFVGMESSLSASGEVKQPSRTIPWALALALLSVAVIYILIQVVAQGIMGPSLAHSNAPLADAMAHISPSLRALMLVGAALSMFGWLGSDILGSPRILFAFARDGVLPRVLGRVHPRTHTPYVAILAYAAVAILLALTGTFAGLAVLSTLPIVALYAMGCIAAWMLARRGVALAGPPLNFRWLGAATLIGVLGMLTTAMLASWQEIAGLLIVIGLSILLYFVQARALSTNVGE